MPPSERDDERASPHKVLEHHSSPMEYELERNYSFEIPSARSNCTRERRRLSIKFLLHVGWRAAPSLAFHLALMHA